MAVSIALCLRSYYNRRVFGAPEPIILFLCSGSSIHTRLYCIVQIVLVCALFVGGQTHFVYVHSSKQSIVASELFVGFVAA